MVEKKRLAVIHLVIYCIIFYFVWSIRELAIRPMLENSFGEWQNAIIGTVVKLFVWTIPAIILIKYFEADMWVSLKTMFSSKVKWFKYLLILIGFLVYQLIITYFSFGKIAVNSEFKVTSLMGAVLFVGITEEIVFRGWLLNATLSKLKSWYAVLINATLFLFIHFPIWIYTGVFTNLAMIFQNCLGVFVLSIIFAWTFIKSKNIFVPNMLHMVWNLLNTVLFG